MIRDINVKMNLLKTLPVIRKLLIFGLFMTNLANSTVNLIIVNTSNKTLCIEGRYFADYFSRGAAEIEIETKRFYNRDGVIEISIGDGPKFYALLNKNIDEASIHVDKLNKIHAEPGAFAEGSFKFSDEDDFLKFVLFPEMEKA